MRRFSRSLRLVMAGVVMLAGAVGVTHASSITRQFNLPVTMNLSASATQCSNAPGPQITLQGTLALGGLGMDMIFKNNVKGTHTYTTISDIEVEVVPAGGSVTLPKQPVLGGVGGNPFIWLQLLDENHHALTSEIYLGRCVQGSFGEYQQFALPAVATASLATSDCSNNPGPYITMDGEMKLSGLNGQLIFRNNDNPVGGPHSATDEVRMNVVLLPAGQTISFPKQPVLGGVGGNPWIFAQFLQENGDAVGNEALMGRCVQLSQ
ncbi:MAG TPA: hypothetical protein VE404_08640 [Verrucomicrobiae bacterium]|nr:hypothetical protein [Verrucomicrobiae bacterium]